MTKQLIVKVKLEDTTVLTLFILERIFDIVLLDF